MDQAAILATLQVLEDALDDAREAEDADALESALSDAEDQLNTVRVFVLET
jgi:hypothetical protein